MLSQMKPWQKINHFPAMYLIARKTFLGKNLKKLQKLFPDEYQFFPRTWILPQEMPELRQYAAAQRKGQSKKKKATFIVKPDCQSQGKGIFLTHSMDEIPLTERMVVQEYLKEPLLLDGLKFDVRLYVLITSCDPLKLYLFHEGIVRLATEPYDSS